MTGVWVRSPSGIFYVAVPGMDPLPPGQEVQVERRDGVVKTLILAGPVGIVYDFRDVQAERRDASIARDARSGRNGWRAP